MKKAILAVGIMALAACSDATSPTRISTASLKPATALLPGNNTVVVTASSLNGACQTPAAPFYCSVAFPSGWLFYNDAIDQGDPTLGSFVTGPANPLNGVGSAQISVSGSQKWNLATYEFAGTPLASITTMSYRTYNPSAGNGGSTNRSAYLQFNVDFNGTDTWQRRLVYVPAQNGTVTPNSWKSWDAIAGGTALWNYSGATWPVTGQPGATLKTWNQILTDYPSARIRVTDAHLSLRVGEPYADGYTENIDSFTFGTAVGTTVYDFEAQADFGSCNVSVSSTTITLLSNCITDRTLYIPDGFTLEGNEFSITGVDPAGGHFLGAVVKNGGVTANVSNLTVTVSGLADLCDDGTDRLRGIMFEGAAGYITNNTVTGINQGASGCQEGNGIEARNLPLGVTGPDLAVTISGNVISGYQKTGILANGSVTATITSNTITGVGPINYIASNGIQVSRGATAIVQNNTVSGNDYTPASTVACGLLFFEADGVKTSKNTLFSNERDICNFGKGGGNVKPAS